MQNTFHVNSLIYDIEKINIAISDFWDIATIQYVDDTLNISNVSEDISVEEVFHELMNYILSL